MVQVLYKKKDLDPKASIKLFLLYFLMNNSSWKIVKQKDLLS